MNAEIISVGTELMLGCIPNTDAQYISSRLTDLGINVVCHSTVNDEPKDIKSALSHALPRSSVIIFTGGLGPTPDDLTKETVCGAVGLNLTEHAESKRRIEEYFARIGKTPTKNNYKQAMLPEQATVFENDHGTAPGCAISAGKQWIFMLPGPPDELKPMFDKSVIPYLKEIGTKAVTVIRTLSVFGKGESQIADAIDKYLHTSNPVVATYVSDGVVSVKVTVRGENHAACEAVCDRLCGEISDILGDCVFSDNGSSLAETAVDRLKKNKVRVTTAESCTAGMLSAAITSVKGASEVISAGIVAYSEQVKTGLLGIPEALIEKYGVYSADTAMAMSYAAYRIGKSALGVGITGIASPDPSTEKPAGLVYVALYDGIDYYVRELHMGRGTDADREKVRRGAVLNALDMIRLYLDKRFSSVGECVPGKDALRKAESEKQAAAAAAVTAIASDEIMSETADETAAENAAENGGDPFLMSSGFEIPGATAAVDEVAEDGAEDIYSDSLIYNDIMTGDDIYIDDKENKKEKGFRRFLKSIFPWKGDTTAQKIRKIALIFFALVFIGSAVYIADYVAESIRTKNELSQLQGIYDPNAEGVLDSHGINVNFANLLEMNPDTIGWLYVPGTEVNNPVVKKDNSYYLKVDFEGNTNKHGTIFADENCTIAPGKLSTNTVLYGHHMKDGTMFGQLKYYRTDTSDGLNFYKNNPIVEFTTIYQTKATKWKIFAVFVTNANAAQDNGYVFNYWNQSFATEQQYAQFIYECQRRSMIDAPVEVTTNDQILTLSTCIYDFSDARLVVMARLVRDGESDAVETSAATVNSDAKFPVAYYGSGSVPADTTSSIVTLKGAVSNDASSVPEVSSEEPDSSQTSSRTSSAFSRPSTNSSYSGSSHTSSSGGSQPESVVSDTPEPESSTPTSEAPPEVSSQPSETPSSEPEPEPSSEPEPEPSSEAPPEPPAESPAE